jgi:hypothetical protein
LDGPSIQTDRNRSRRIVWRIKRMIRHRMVQQPRPTDRAVPYWEQRPIGGEPNE